MCLISASFHHFVYHAYHRQEEDTADEQEGFRGGTEEQKGTVVGQMCREVQWWKR